MKKEYIKPQMKAIKIRYSRILMASGGVYSSITSGTGSGDITDLDITYGGIDESGTLDPE